MWKRCFLLVVLALVSGSFASASPGHWPSPFQVTVTSASKPGDLAPVKDWLKSDELKVKIYAIVQITNISMRPVVLAEFCHGRPGIVFSSKSPNARRPKDFVIASGQNDWMLLKPGESAYGVANIAADLTFLKAGTYDLDYEISVKYSYYKEPPAGQKETDLAKAYPGGSSSTVQGNLKVEIKPDQVSSL